jgi:phosphatidylinositol alpha-1,6-mannosyltransferase
MKTLLFTLEYPPFRGGVANFYGNLAKYWPLGEKLVVLDNQEGKLMSRRKLFPWFKAIDVLEAQMTFEKADYLLVGQILPLGTVALIASWLHSWPYGVFLHGMDLSLALKSARKRLLARLILGRARHIICANSYVEEKLLERWPGLSGKTILVNPGVEGGAPVPDPYYLEEMKEKYRLAGKTVLLSLGRLVKRKGVDRTIEALAIHIPEAERENLVYFIAGAGPREEYLKQLVPPALSRQIVFLGEISEDEKWAWLHLADIFIMPSRNIAGDFEGFGIVYLEAALCGKPVIAGNAGGVRDAVKDGQTGLLVDPEKSDEIAAAIRRLAADSELRLRLGQEGQARAKREFNWEKQAAALVDALQEEKR